MHKHNSARAAFRTSIIRCKMLCSAFHSLIINLAAKVRRIFGVCKLFAIFSYGVPKELCSNGESRGLGRPLILSGSPKSFARMGRGGAMERFISACRNPLAKSATTKAICHCDPSAECDVPLFPRGMKGTKKIRHTQAFSWPEYIIFL